MMRGIRRRTAAACIAVFASICLTIAYAKEPAMSKGTTLCFGRFLIDLPEGVHIKEMGQQSSFTYGDISSEPFREGAEGFKNRMILREADARVGKNPKNYEFEKVIHTSIPNTRIFVTSRDIFGQKLFRFEMYHWVDGFLFSMAQGPYEEEKIGPIVRELGSRVIARLRVRAPDEIPTEPGFCIKDGFIADDGRTEHFEEARMQINLQEWPDVWISFYSQTVPKGGEQTLLQRVASHPFTGIYAVLAKQIKTFRRGEHDVNGFKGEEILDLMPTDEGYKQHSFRWETLGAVKSIFAPSIVLEFESGTPLDGKPRRPTLSDDQAIKLYDSMVNSIRLRPTSAPVKTNVDEPPKKPLGERAATGSTCPQTGWWESEDEGVVAEWRRRHFKAGDVLPMARRHGQPSLWQQVKGERPVEQFATIWRLVEYGDAPQHPDATPTQASTSPDTDAGKDAGTPGEG